MRRWLKFGVVVFFAIVLATLLAFSLSPRPSVWVIRQVFDSGAAAASAKLADLVPQSVGSAQTVRYDPSDPDALLDIYRPGGSQTGGPVVVWFHGGGFVSGRRGDVANYLKILAGRGFTVVNVDYTIAPEATYPTPIRQAQTALRFLDRNAAQLRLPSRRFVVAGDSAGAQIAAQTAATITNAAYAREVGIAAGLSADQLVGALLFCGVYNISQMGGDGGIFGWFIGTTKWAYSGAKGAEADRRLATMSVVPRISGAFPPSFISAGNNDPLGPQSVALADALRKNGVSVQTRFFPQGYDPPLGHEYQFDLSTQAGRTVLDEAAEWLKAR